MNQPKKTNLEKLNWWDRLFNKTRKTVVERGSENWERKYPNDYANQIYNQVGKVIPNSTYGRDFVVYKITDRVTGSEKIVKEYLN